ncbi:MAG: hypothetical protein H6882_07145 [Rhodobiaceae bacterium]|nr:hypothetical protein [Rhodobiaceae bacterium]
MDKTAKLLAGRLAVYGGSVVKEIRCAHDAGAVAKRLRIWMRRHPT